MTTAPTWWESEHAVLREIAEDGPERWADAGPPFSDALLELMAAVEDAFTLTGADTPGWADPHLGPDGEDRDVLQEEYGRCLDPGRCRILWSRAEAWSHVLVARGRALRDDLPAGDIRSGLRWVSPPPIALHRTTVLRPRPPGTQPLILARTAPDRADAQILGLVVGAGEPAVLVSTVPDCGCDACDSGSRDLLESLDRTLLSLLDGFFETVPDR